MNATILMSTYNGEKYINEQLESIVKQTFTGNITILIRDDGSQDKTTSLIEAYPQKDHRVIQIIEAPNIGPQKSFLQLLEMAEQSDYYFFADQDDIWYKEKIEYAIQLMEKETGPVCYCSNYDVFDSELEKKEESFIKTSPAFRPLKILFYNQIPGCTMGFNWALMEVIRQIHVNNCMMHDSMVLALAACCGTIIYDPVSRIAHRIHESNVVGAGHKKIIPHKWIAEKAKLIIHKETYDLSEMADQFIQTGRVKESFLKDVLLLRDFKKSWKNTLRLLKHPDSNDKAFDRTTLSIRSKILFHLF